MAIPFPATESAWALRAYLILIGCAADRQTVTYDALCRRIKRGSPNLLARPLDMIARWCQRNELPALASLVVEPTTGLPAPGFMSVSRGEVPREQERVWEFDWYAILPPTLQELAEKSK
jgi:putative restriction endonuclease